MDDWLLAYSLPHIVELVNVARSVKYDDSAAQYTTPPVAGVGDNDMVTVIVVHVVEA